MIRRPPRYTLAGSSAASDVYKRQDRDRERDRDRDRQTDRQTETERQRNRPRPRDGETDRDRKMERQAETERWRDRQRQRDGETDRNREMERQTGRDREMETAEEERAVHSQMMFPLLSLTGWERTNSVQVPSKSGSPGGNSMGKHSLPQE